MFDNANDQQSIANCLENHPTWAIFAGRQKKRESQKGRNKKSIFSWASNVSCLAAMVYYGGENNFSHILWLGTTLDPPPIESKHSSWRSIGLASFLVAVLVKQHLCQATDEVAEHHICSSKCQSKAGCFVLQEAWFH
ncbi:MAG: hypothetical protein MZW92_54495 [Comamonadaceae bacterium]|nr:hypothetical protein [Comamonadaceae bacterium]